MFQSCFMKKHTPKNIEKLPAHIEKRNVIKLLRELKIGTSNVLGSPLAQSPAFILIQSIYDFAFVDGYLIVPVSSVDKVRFNKFDKTYTAIVKAEGLEKDYGIKYNVDILGWKQLFNSLIKQDIHVIVECENNDIPNFFIGAITRVGAKTVSIHNYDAAGKLDEKPTRIKYSDITIVHFDDVYSKTFRKYLKPPKKSKQ